MTNINVHGFDTTCNRYEYKYEYRLADTTYASEWIVFTGDATPTVSSTEVEGQGIALQPGDVVVDSLRVSYRRIDLISDSVMDITSTEEMIITEDDTTYNTKYDTAYVSQYDTTWNTATELQAAMWTVRALPTFTMADTVACMIDEIHWTIDYSETDEPMFSWMYYVNAEEAEIVDMANYDIDEDPYIYTEGGFGTPVAHIASMNSLRSSIVLDEIEKNPFDTMLVYITLTTGNTSCPVAKDTAMLTVWHYDFGWSEHVGSIFLRYADMGNIVHQRKK